MYEPMYQGYSSGVGGTRSGSSRLPPIHAIGRSKAVVDEDEPPDVPLHVYGFDEAVDPEHSFSSVESVFDAADAEDVCKLLRKAFHMLGPGRHACKRNPDHGGSHFVHCKRAAKLGCYYSRLQYLLEERAWMELLRDCVYRVCSTQQYVEELTGLLTAEYKTVYAIRHGCVVEAPVSKLYCLNALCEDLRVHVGHWNSIKQRVHTSRWLRPMLGFIICDLGAVQRMFAQLCDRALFIIDHLVQVGFEVLAHCDPTNLTPDILWNITRGLEDFNNIVANYRLQSSLEVANGAQKDRNCQAYSCLYLHPVVGSRMGQRLSEGVKSIPFQKVLGILANERSRYAAQLSHRFFTTNEAFLNSPVILSHQRSFHWDEDLGSTISAIHLQSQVSVSREDSIDSSSIGPAPSLRRMNTVAHPRPFPLLQRNSSDVQSSWESADVPSSRASISSATLNIGSLRIPDLSNLPSPLVDFSHREQHFAEKFLQIVCNSTSLLRKNNDRTKSKARNNPQQESKAPPMSPVVGRKLAKVQMQGDTPVLFRADSRRKTVSWGDNADTSIRTQVVAIYMNVLWQHFGRNMDLFLDEPAWTGKVGLLHSSMGTVFMYGDTVIAVIRFMMEHICLKDMFPPGSVSPLLGVVVRLHALSAFAAWDSYMSRANSSQPSDKCNPVLAWDGQYCTHTGKYLLDAYHPLLSLLYEVSRSAGHSNGESSDLMPQYDLDLTLVSGICSRLLCICLMTCSWCSGKLHSFLSAGNLKTFLFVANTDLKMLRDHSQRAYQLLQLLHCSSQSKAHTSVLDQLSMAHITESVEQLDIIMAQLQSLESTSLKLFTEKFSQGAEAFFQEYLPPVKSWRCKVPPEFPEDCSSYIQQMWDGLLAPVTEGVAKLPMLSQMEVLTTVVTMVCGSWTTALLKEKTKFSFYGAQQLGVDVENLRARFNTSSLDPVVRQRMQELNIFRQMSGIVQLLKRQPARRPTSRFRDCSSEDLTCETRDANHSRSASRSELPANMEESQDANDVCLVTNSDEWLALRVIGGSRTWRFPSCFGADSGH